MNENERIVCEFLRKIAPSREWEYLGEVEHYWIGELCDELTEQLKAENAELRKELKERPTSIDIELMTAFVDCLRDAAEHYEDINISGVDYTPLHKPTVADVLREFADGIKNQNAGFTELAIAEYAKRLQLAEGDDDE